MSTSFEIVPFRRRDLSWETSPEFIAIRDEAVGMASLITVVNSVESNETAAAAAKACAELRLAAQKFHREAKAPILQCGRELDARLDDAIGVLRAEEARLSRLTGDFVAGVEAQRRALLAAAEANAKADDNALQEALSKATSVEENQRIREEFAFKAQQSASEVAVPMPARAAGQSLKAVWEIELVNVHELVTWAAKTGMTSVLKVEIRKTEMVALLDKGIVVPGIKAEKVNKTSQR